MRHKAEVHQDACYHYIDTFLTILYKTVMELLISASKIAEKVESLGIQISKEYQSKNLHILVILKGSFMFASDLVRYINVPFQIDFIKISTYGNKDMPDTKPLITLDQIIDIKGKDVLIVDDILDTGHTLFDFSEFLGFRNPNSIKICTLLDKSCRREVDITPDFWGFKINDGFVVGYGLDYAENFRGLPQIYVLNEEEIRRG
jgi:hypoxanthine phosphoribosyltransferase